MNMELLKQALEIAKLLDGGEASALDAIKGDGRPVIVRSRDAGVQFGYLDRYEGSTVYLTKARQMWSWTAAEGGTLLDCATNGYGYGNGSGYGTGNGSGFGTGDGNGSGDGSGFGDGYGDGSGYGDGCGKMPWLAIVSGSPLMARNGAERRFKTEGAARDAAALDARQRDDA
jgi:hypothetical protein